MWYLGSCPDARQNRWVNFQLGPYSNKNRPRVIVDHGLKWIELIGLGDKHKITAAVHGTLSGDFLPLQLVLCSGKTTACLPNKKFPKMIGCLAAHLIIVNDQMKTKPKNI